MSHLKTKRYCPQCGSGPRQLERMDSETPELTLDTRSLNHHRCENCGFEWPVLEHESPPELTDSTISNRIPVAVMAFFTGMFTAIWAGGHTAPTMTPRVSGYFAVATALVTLGFILMGRGDDT